MILIVDDLRALAEQYAYDLARIGGYETQIATNGPAALQAVEGGGVECLVLDLEMPGMDGFEVLETLRHRGNETPIIVYTGTGDYERCIRAIRLGADGFIDKAEPVERVAQEIAGALERSRLRREVRALQERLGESALAGRSAALVRLREAIARVAPIPSAVLVLGESGTGKELVARELHRLGANPAAPFIAINCAALPEQLVESELFGHEKGAFTGALATRKGAFEAAERGTLFLDEIGELPLPAQAKLLRVLEDRTVTRLGSSRTVAVEARVVAATNRDPDAEVREGRFREDLLYRLNVHVLRVPSLRERREDVALLAARFADETCRRFGMLPKELSGEAREILVTYDWRRNNVRELRNVIERMIVAADGETLRAEHVPVEVRRGGSGAGGREADGKEAGGEEAGHTAAGGTEAGDGGRRVRGGGGGGGGGTWQELRLEAERRIVLAALERHDWQITRTAEALGLADHASLLKIMRRLDVKRVEGEG